MTKKVFIKSYGCQMNVYDSERMADVMSAEGYMPTETMQDADMIILNTCHIREKAAEKVYSELGRVRQVKEQRKGEGRGTIVTVAGCVAQAEGEEIVKRAQIVDVVVGPQSYQNLPQLLTRHKLSRKPVIETEFPDADKFSALPSVKARNPVAFLTVQEGCDKFCTFCVVPYTRGAEFSRPARDLLGEARRLVKGGVKEITLLGQNVNAYHGEGLNGKSWSLADLLKSIADLEGLERLRYTTSHPRDMSDDLIRAHKEIEILMPYLHLPFQAGSDKILKAMNRQHTGWDYLNIIEKIRSHRPDIALSTDIIVGFPGEEESDFEATLQMVEAVQFASAYSFKYSARPGTPASELGTQIDEDIKRERLQRLQQLINQQQRAFNRSFIGKEMKLLLEREGKVKDQLVGRSPYLQAVYVPKGEAEIGDMVEVQITEAGDNALRAVIKPTTQ